MSKKESTGSEIDRTVQPWMLEDAIFAKVLIDGEVNISVMTNDSVNHPLKAKDAIKMSDLSGKGPARLKDWLILEWFPKAFGDDIVERMTQRILQRQKSKQGQDR